MSRKGKTFPSHFIEWRKFSRLFSLPLVNLRNLFFFSVIAKLFLVFLQSDSLSSSPLVNFRQLWKSWWIRKSLTFSFLFFCLRKLDGGKLSSKNVVVTRDRQYRLAARLMNVLWCLRRKRKISFSFFPRRNFLRCCFFHRFAFAVEKLLTNVSRISSVAFGLGWLRWSVCKK